MAPFFGQNIPVLGFPYLEKYAILKENALWYHSYVNSSTTLNVTRFKRPKVKKRFLPKFLLSSTDCGACKDCDHAKTSYNDLLRPWSTTSYNNQYQFMAFVGKEVAEKLNEDYQGNIVTWKQDGNYSDKTLIDLEKTSYLKNRSGDWFVLSLEMQEKVSSYIYC